MKKYIYLIFTVLVSLFVGTASAQVTTSSLSGQVTDENGETLPGATVIAVHTPSGTQYACFTNESGRYFIQGMRPGGPYKVTMQFVGMKPSEYPSVYLPLGETTNIDAKLQSETNELQQVVITADAPKANTGAATNYDLENIQNTPTINRSVYDVAKLNPQAQIVKGGGISFAGSNNRYNSFQIDGTVSNDVFGLSSDGTNGAQTGANPISLESIQEIQVVVSPFDVTQSGFTGGGINAVTKSGTNKFAGTAYLYYTDENFYGKYSQVKEKDEKLDKEMTRTMGANVGGAIVKDKLFFFANIENTRKEWYNNYFPGADYYNKEGKYDYISVAEATAVADKFKSVTGVQESIDQKELEQNAWNFLARLDWNINSKHKLALRYQYNDSYRDSYSSGSYSNGSQTYYFGNSGYRMVDKTNSVVLELNSRFNDKLYNEFRAGLTTVRDHRELEYISPNIEIKSAGGEYDATNNVWGKGNKKIYIGSEYSSGANGLDVNVYTLEDNLSLYKGDHTFTFGTHEEFYKFNNLFIQAVNGAYYYNSTQDFLNDNAYQFVYKYSDPDITGTTRWAGTVKAGQFGFYAQDKWRITNLFTLTYGLRIDMPLTFNSPSSNAAFNESEYAKNFGVKVGEAPETAIMWSPRLGFRWYLDSDRKILVRGGVGMFTGRVPFVWLTNLWNNTGVEMKGTTISKDVPSFAQYGTDPDAAMKSAAGTASKPDINTADKKFKYPQVLRTSLAIERRLPYGLKITLEGIYSKTLNNVFFENLALHNPQKVYAVEGVEASAAPYYSINSGDYYSIINLKNTNKGYTYTESAKIEQSFSFGLDWMISYTHTRSKSVNDGTSSVASSCWKYNNSIDTNSPDELSYSMYDLPHKIMATIAYTSPKYANGLLSSTIAITYNGFSGQRYCLTMDESKDYNGDGYKGNSLLYIPTEDELPKMKFKTEEDRQKFADWIADDDYASENRGKYAHRYSNIAPFEHHFDLHFAENIFYLKERGSKIQLTFDITNFGNLLNKEWGTYYKSAYKLAVLKYESIDKTVDDKTVKENVFSFNKGELDIDDVFSRWRAQIGIRVTF